MGRLVQWGPRFRSEEDSELRRLKTELEKKLDMELTDRQFLLLKDTPLPAPRIPRGPSRMRMVSHDVRGESAVTDHHRVEGFDTDIFRKAQDAREQKKVGR